MSGSRSSESKKESETAINPTARRLASTSTGTIEALCMFPLDRAKNLKQLGDKITIVEAVTTINYKGLTPYIFHKIFARYVVLGEAQPFFMSQIRNSSFFPQLEQGIGKDNAKVVAATLGGGLAGITEVAGNPIDRWKLICQKQKLRADDALKLMRQEGIRAQYAGSRETMIRNMAGASTTFFGKFVTYKMLGLQDHNNPTFLASLSSSMVGAGLRVAVSHLPDVAKNRAQMDPKNKMSVTKRVLKIVEQEGAGALYAGAGTKLLASALKFGVVLTTCDMVTAKINRLTFFQAAPPSQKVESSVSDPSLTNKNRFSRS